MAIRQGLRQDSRSRHLTLWSWPDSEKARIYRTQLPLAPSFLKQEGRLVIACEKCIGGSGTWQGQTMRKASVPENRRRKPAGKQDLPGRTSIIRCPTTECPYHSTQTGICRERETSPARLWSYDGPRYACLNEGEVYDRLIGEDDFGRFANSFLIIASKDGRQEKTIFRQV